MKIREELSGIEAALHQETHRRVIDLGHVLSVRYGVSDLERNTSFVLQSCEELAVSNPRETLRTVGLRHFASAAGRCAVGELPAQSCEGGSICNGCTDLAEEDRFCVRIGNALATGDVDDAVKLSIEFDRRSAGVDENRDYAIGVSEGMGVIATMPKYRRISDQQAVERQAHWDEFENMLDETEASK